jgi:RNA polymerase II subunit A small phosphatase-like protein
MMGNAAAKKPGAKPPGSPGSPRNADGSPLVIGSPAPGGYELDHSNAGGRKRSLQMDPDDMGKLLTQFQAGDLLSPKRPSAAATGGSVLLPPPEDPGRRCLVIDLDETLVHTERQPSGFPGGKYDFKISVKIGASTYSMYVKKRPGCDAFLKKAAEHYELVIFTASMEQYCTAVMEHIDPDGDVSYCLHRAHCTFYESQIYVKDLSRLGRDIKNTILIDNNPDCYLFQPENAIPINSWYDDPADMDLEHLLGILDLITKQDRSAVSVLAEVDEKLGWGRSG